MSKETTKTANLSGTCQCDICGDDEFLVVHHIRGRKMPRFDEPFNRSNICQNCHYKVHLGEIILENWVTTTSGRMLLCHLKGEESITGDDAIPHMIKKKYT